MIDSDIEAQDKRHNFVTQNCYNVLDKVIQHVFVHACMFGCSYEFYAMDGVI